MSMERSYKVRGIWTRSWARGFLKAQTEWAVRECGVTKPSTIRPIRVELKTSVEEQQVRVEARGSGDEKLDVCVGETLAEWTRRHDPISRRGAEEDVRIDEDLSESFRYVPSKEVKEPSKRRKRRR